MEQAIFENVQDNTDQGRKRMALKAKKKSKRAMDSDSDELEANEERRSTERRLDEKLQKFKEIVDFTVVPGMDQAVKQFIIMS